MPAYYLRLRGRVDVALASVNDALDALDDAVDEALGGVPNAAILALLEAQGELEKVRDALRVRAVA
jgi:hypothetical protein